MRKPFFDPEWSGWKYAHPDPISPFCAQARARASCPICGAPKGYGCVTAAGKRCYNHSARGRRPIETRKVSTMRDIAILTNPNDYTERSAARDVERHIDDLLEQRGCFVQDKENALRVVGRCEQQIAEVDRVIAEYRDLKSKLAV